MRKCGTRTEGNNDVCTHCKLSLVGKCPMVTIGYLLYTGFYILWGRRLSGYVQSILHYITN